MRKSILPILLGFFLLVFAATLAARRYTSANHHSAVESERPAVHVREPGLNAFRDIPLRAGPRSMHLMPVSVAESEWLDEQISPPRGEAISASFCYHLLQVHGLDATFAHDVLCSSEAILRILTDSHAGEAFFGQSPVTLQANGVRFVTANRELNMAGRGLESHRDQCVATLADLGIPLSFGLSIGDRHFVLRDALRDSISNFHLKQNELEWTSIAYAAYLPPTAEWVNRYGERYTFDDLVQELLDRPLYEASCGGAHILIALTKLYCCDAQECVLAPSTRERLARYLRECASYAAQAQEGDGSWSPASWRRALQLPQRDGAATEEFADRLLLTGHIAEWLLCLPEELFDSEFSLKRAGVWLMKAVRSSTAEDQHGLFCSYSHAVKVLRNITFISEHSGDG